MFQYLLPLILWLPTAEAMIYGDDSFQTISKPQGSGEEAPLSSALGMQINHYKIKEEQTAYPLLSARPLEMRGICKDDPWSRFESIGHCTGFLISSKFLLTAGHCMKDKNDCESSLWIFPESPFEELSEEVPGYLKINQRNVVRCKSRVSGYYNSVEEAPLDYALVELDRELPNHHTVSINPTATAKVGQEVFTFSYPLGTSLKYSEGLVQTKSDVYLSNIDSMRGSSGAPVFSKTTGDLIGLLARGETRFIPDMKNACNRINRCEDNQCRGEDIIPIQSILDDLKKKGIELL